MERPLNGVKAYSEPAFFQEKQIFIHIITFILKFKPCYLSVASVRLILIKQFALIGIKNYLISVYKSIKLSSNIIFA
jgi:hypothetical protein